MSDQKRPYRKTRRAELEEQTRRRITESAVALHEELGPAHTSISAIAERAGVRRSTVYRHFPDERALLLACSGHYLSANPMPDPEPWLAIQDPAERLRRGLSELYAFFEETEPMLSSVLRDAEVHALTREIVTNGRGVELQRIREVLKRGVRGRHRHAVLELALAFTTWRTLVRAAGLSNAQAVETLVRAFAAA